MLHCPFCVAVLSQALQMPQDSKPPQPRHCPHLRVIIALHSRNTDCHPSLLALAILLKNSLMQTESGHKCSPWVASGRCGSPVATCPPPPTYNRRKRNCLQRKEAKNETSILCSRAPLNSQYSRFWEPGPPLPFHTEGGSRRLLQPLSSDSGPDPG